MVDKEPNTPKKEGWTGDVRLVSSTLLGTVGVITFFVLLFSGIIMHPQPSSINQAIVQPSLTSQSTTTNANYLLTAIDQHVTTKTNTVVDITLEGSDPDKSDSLTAAIVKKPSHGTLSYINQVTGIVTYTPNQHFTGYDSFSFKVNNGRADSKNNATVNIRVG